MKAIIPIVGEINTETVDLYKSIIDSTENISEIHFKIDSQGGFVEAADNIISHAKSLGVKIITEQTGKVMSAASKIMAIGDERIGNKGDEKNIMIHLPRVTTKNTPITSEVANKISQVLTTIEKEFIDTYGQVMKVGKDKIRKMMSKETFMTNKEALELGLLTKINARALESKLNSFQPVAYIDLSSLTQTENKMEDKEVQGLVDKVLAAFDKREEAKKAKHELSEVKASNEDLAKQLEEAKAVQVEADNKVKELEEQLKASNEEKISAINDAKALAEVTQSLLEEVKAFKEKEVKPADEEVLVTAEQSEDKPVVSSPVQLMA